MGFSFLKGRIGLSAIVKYYHSLGQKRVVIVSLVWEDGKSIEIGETEGEREREKKRRRLETTPRPYTQYRSNFHYIVYKKTKKKKTNVVGNISPHRSALFGSVDRADRISRTG